MNLFATLTLYGGGVGSGCQGPNCGRKPGSGMLQENQADTPIDTRFMSLSLKVQTGPPFLFENSSKLVWHWSPDNKSLHIETELSNLTENPNGYTEKEVYEIPAENIKSWGPQKESTWNRPINQSPSWKPKYEQTSPSPSARN